jgi:hypothetical protein
MNRASVIAVCWALALLAMPRGVRAQGSDRTPNEAALVADPQPVERDEGAIPIGFGIGVSGERRIASDPNASDVWGIAVFPRFIARGFGPAFDFPLTKTGVVNRLRSGSPELGVIWMIPAMAGLAWQTPVGTNVSVALQLVAGYSFNFAAASGERPLRAQVAVPQAVVDVGDGIAWETQVTLWRELAPRLGLMVSGRYLHIRPRFTFADGSERVWKGDRVILAIGLAFTLIKAQRARDRSAAATPTYHARSWPTSSARPVSAVGTGADGDRTTNAAR